VLDDETGLSPVVVLGSCNPGAAEALPERGDRVRVTEIVQVLKSEAPRDVRVQTTVFGSDPQLKLIQHTRMAA
jgi:hypothetical protein